MAQTWFITSSLILISSIGARVATPGLSIYYASKAAVSALAETLALEVAGIADVVHWSIVAAEIAAALNRSSQLRRPEANPPPSSSRGAYGLAH
jgi:short-subunit dehydrogenase